MVCIVMPAIDSSIEREFARLVAKWKDETGAFSTTYDKVVNDSFLQIMALGKAVVPLILEDINHGSGHRYTDSTTNYRFSLPPSTPNTVHPPAPFPRFLLLSQSLTSNLYVGTTGGTRKPIEYRTH